MLVDPAKGSLQRRPPGLAIVHLQLSDDQLLVGAWGQGVERLPLGEIGP